MADITETIERRRKSGDRERTRPSPDASWTIQFEGQMLLFGLLAKVFYGEPEREWLDGVVRSALFQTVPIGEDVDDVRRATAFLVDWTNRQSEGIGADEFDRLTADFGLLFVGPGRLKAAPWASVYANGDRAVFQHESVAVRNWYERFGLALDSTYNQPADHAGLMFGFLSYLAQATIHAAAASEGKEVQNLIDAQRAFIRQHMVGWITRWADDVVANARTDYFRGMGLLARGVLAETQSFLLIEDTSLGSTGPFRKGVGSRGNRQPGS